MNSTVIDAIIRIKNGYHASLMTVTVPQSKLVMAVLNILQKEKYIQSFVAENDMAAKNITVELLYQEGASALHGVNIVSKPGKRMYSKTKDLKKIMGGLGTAIVSTPKGLMTGSDAKKNSLGGEVLFIVW